ncbi:PHP domain-containing protein [Clostridium swellfunianum]|uniref:PHP domain-containing protein n=1 Tax=Clostridium swellfunianum TaxID=1367462 RepID=UPI00202FFCED|nr:PHP domain-containing protein [Clostridium swellfunianum]MCM0648566.1 PHP domain-containing protein [Clostridium swellfunianum]
MQFTDLHIHSRYSDGMLWPEQIIKIAMKKGLKYLSITDHDTVNSQFSIDELSSRYKINIVPGLELSTEYKDREIHILAYFIDVEDTKLQVMLEKTRESRINRAKEIIHKLNSIGIDISYAEILQEGVSIGRPHIAKILVSKGYANTTKEAFHQYLMKDKPAYVDRFKVNYKDALKLISDCKGISVLAHPGEIYKGIQIEELLREFRVYGLKGIEVFHPSHTQKQTNDYYNLAKKYSLHITGGSDCHGAFADAEAMIGTYGIDERLTNKFVKSKIY